MTQLKYSRTKLTFSHRVIDYYFNYSLFFLRPEYPESLNMKGSAFFTKNNGVKLEKRSAFHRKCKIKIYLCTFWEGIKF